MNLGMVEYGGIFPNKENDGKNCHMTNHLLDARKEMFHFANPKTKSTRLGYFNVTTIGLSCVGLG